MPRYAAAGAETVRGAPVAASGPRCPVAASGPRCPTTATGRSVGYRIAGHLDGLGPLGVDGFRG
ncbi:hypothetical protein [Streptomyces chrestomyceticus]|uniref:hypothetical protein n=1 Tax=Streptomyces chrestomyceticus TaxID=68185 RepID=UPI0033C2614F